MKCLFLLSLCTFTLVPSDAPTKTTDSKFWQKTLYGTVIIGAAASFIFWLPGTMQTVERHGISGAIASTHIPRLAIDVLAIAACVNAWYQADKKEISCNCPNKSEGYYIPVHDKRKISEEIVLKRSN